MQLFVVSHRSPSIDERSLSAAVSAAAEPFPGLASSAVWSATSKSGDVVVAAVHHDDAVAAPRVYRARRADAVVLYDGLPVERAGRLRGHDAAVLLEHWDELHERLEGQYAAVRIDLAADDVSLMTDSMGISPVFALAHEGGYLVGNSIEAIRRASHTDAPSALGVSSFLSMGWAVGDSTLLAGVHALAGGRRYQLTRAGLIDMPYLTPASVATRGRSGPEIGTEELVTSLAELTGSAVSAQLPLRCALTGGRDTRVMLALLRACGADHAEYYTVGPESAPDVKVARELASTLGLSHKIWPVDSVVGSDWVALTKTFVSQTDGLSSLIQIRDYADQLRSVSNVGLKAGGLGGEIGRTGVSVVPYASNVPIFALSWRLQELLLRQWSRDFRHLWTDDAIHVVNEFLRRFVEERRAEGWPLRTVSEAFYAFDRVIRWGSNGLRRTSNTDDYFSPFCSQPFVHYCFGLTPEERYLEAPHYRILSALSPALRDLPFAKPWKPQQPLRAPLIASTSFARLALERTRVRRRLGLRGGRSSAARRRLSRVAAAWFDAHAHEHLDLCLSLPDSPLWTWIDRTTVERAFRAEPAQRVHLREGLLRVATLFWYFHGRHLH